jgi:hypothetical protein
MKEFKPLYETTVNKVVEEPSIEIREEQGQKVEVKKTIKQVKPIKLAILKPDRKLFKAAEMFYAKAISDYLKAGLLPYSLVAKRYANDGGVLTDKERDRIKELKDEARKLEGVFYGNKTGENSVTQEERNDALVRINDINLEVSNISNSYSDIFDSTAEVKARNDTIEWWVLFLLYINLDGKDYKPLFGDGTHEERIQKLEDLEDKENPFEIESIKKLSYLISFWFTARNVVNKVDFEAMDKLYVDTMSTYKIDETNTVKISDLTETKDNSTPLIQPIA